MSYLYSALCKKRTELQDIITKTEEHLSKAPEGRLRIAHKGNRPMYYYRTQETDGKYRTGQYIKQKDVQLAYDLAQRDYDVKILEKAKHRLITVNRLIEEYHPNELQEVFTKQNIYRKKLIHPYVITDELYVEKWLSLGYKGKPFAEGTVEIYSEKGERVRSKSEKIIADMLFRESIPYRYEYPVFLQGLGTIYPDFMILNRKERKEVFWEHFGKMDDDEYSEKALNKISCYIKSGFMPGDQLIFTYETGKRPLETSVVKRIMQFYC